MLDTGRALLRPTPFLIGLGVACPAWAMEGWAFHLLLRAFGVSLSPVTSCAIYAAATLAGALSALPGGLGGFEAVMSFLLSRLGMPLATTVIPVMLFRLCTLWFTSFIGLFILIGWLSFSPRPAAGAEIAR